MPAPKRSEPPRRIRIAKPAPVLDGGRYAVKRTVGDTVAVSADIFRDGHEKLRAVVKYKAPGGRSWLEIRAARRRRAHLRRALGGRVRGRDARDAGSSRFEAWTDRWATYHDELRRKVEANLDEDLSGEVSEGLVLLEKALERAKGEAKDSIEYARGVLGLRRADAREVRRRARPGAVRLDGGGVRARGRDDAREAAPARGRPREGALRRLVRALPALLGRPEGRRGPRARDRRPRLRRALPAAVSPDRRQEPQGPQQLAGRRPGRSRLAVRDRRRRGRALRRPPRARHRAGRARPVRHRAPPRHGRGARHRAQRLRRPPVADRAPRVVPAAPGRHAQVRREPAQALPGHLQLQLGHDGLAGALAGLARRLPALDRLPGSSSTASTTRTRSRSRSGSG